jgi:hypothetical protein
MDAAAAVSGAFIAAAAIAGICLGALAVAALASWVARRLQRWMP